MAITKQEEIINFAVILDTQIALAASIVRGLCQPDAVNDVIRAADALAASVRPENKQIASFMDDFADLLRRSL